MRNIIIFVSLFVISISASVLNTVPCTYAFQPTEPRQLSNVFSWFVVRCKLFWAWSYLDVFLVDKIDDMAGWNLRQKLKASDKDEFQIF